MSVRSYRGNRGKNVFEINNFSKGVNATNAAMSPGFVKELVNMDISPDGQSLRPRQPYINYALYDIENGEFVSFSKDIYSFVSKQYPSYEIILDLKGKRSVKRKTVHKYHVVDGDTIDDLTDPDNPVRYRLLIVDAYEINSEEGIAARDFVVGLLDEKPFEVVYDPQAPSWVDAYNRHLVWVYNHEGSNIAKELIVEKHAKYLDIETTEHYDDILKNTFEGIRDYDNNFLVIYDYPGSIPTAYVRNTNEEPFLFEGRPVVGIKPFNNIYMGDLLNDIGFSYSFVPTLHLRDTVGSNNNFLVNYTAIEHNTLMSNDGVVMLGEIELVGDRHLIEELTTTVNINTRAVMPSKKKINKETLGFNIVLSGEVIFGTDLEIDVEALSNISYTITTKQVISRETITMSIRGNGEVEPSSDGSIDWASGNSTLKIVASEGKKTNIEHTILSILGYVDITPSSDGSIDWASGNGNIVFNTPSKTIKSSGISTEVINSTVHIIPTGDLSIDDISGIGIIRNILNTRKVSKTILNYKGKGSGTTNLSHQEALAPLTWKYQGTSSSPFCFPAGYNPIGDSCSTEGQTMEVSGPDIGRPGDCHTLVCRR